MRGGEEPTEGGDADFARADEDDADQREAVGVERFRGRLRLAIDIAKNVHEDANGSLGGIDIFDEIGSVEFEDGFGFFVVGFEAMADGFLVGVVEAVFFEGALFEAGDEGIAIGAGEVEDALDINEFAHNFRLIDASGDAIEDEGIDIGSEAMGADHIADASHPEFHGDFVGDEFPFTGVSEEGLADGGTGIEGAKDIAASAVEEAGDGAEDFALGSFTASWGAED